MLSGSSKRTYLFSESSFCPTEFPPISVPLDVVFAGSIRPLVGFYVSTRSFKLLQWPSCKLKSCMWQCEVTATKDQFDNLLGSSMRRLECWSVRSASAC